MLEYLSVIEPNPSSFPLTKGWEMRGERETDIQTTDVITSKMNNLI